MSVLEIPGLSFSRAVLLVMDDGVGVYSSGSGRVEFLDGFAWREPGFEEKLADCISRSGAASVVILNDAVEQHYRKEKVPIITSFDRANIVQRRLNVAFPNYSMRAAKALKESGKGSKAAADPVNPSASKDKEAVKGELYLFAAVPSNDGFGRIMMALRTLDVQIVGYGLLPIESTSYVDALVKKIAQKTSRMAGARWSVLISQHRGGGLRQIVVKGKELALTRVTPVVEPNPEQPGAWSADVSTEVQATLSYLSRFGYVPEDGLDIIVVGDRQYTEALEEMIHAPCNFIALSVQEAASYAGVKLTGDVDDHFSEAIHVGWAAKKTTLALPLSSRDLNEIKSPRMAALVIMLICSLGVGGVAGWAVDEAMKLYEAYVNQETAMIQKRKIEQIFEEELARKQSMGIDIALIKSSLDINKKLDVVKVDPLSLLEDVAHALQDIRLDRLEFKNTGNEVAGTTPEGQVPDKRATELVLFVSFAGTIKPEDGNEEVQKLADRLTERMSDKGYKASVTKLLQDMSFEATMKEEVGVNATKRPSSDRYKAEITLKRI